MNIGGEFFKLTKYPFLSEADQKKGLPAPEPETPAPGADLINLPDPSGLNVNPVTVQEAINQRRSIRKFSPSPLSLEELAWLLWATQGVQEVRSIATFRTVPSAGARHPFDTYLAAANVTGLKPGLYRYMALSHKLALVREDAGISTALAEACLGQDWMTGAPAIMIWAAVPYRTTWRYSERGWRYLLLDAGHVCENLYLASAAIGGSCCAVDAFDDDALNQVLGLVGEDRFAIYLAPVGKK